MEKENQSLLLENTKLREENRFLKEKIEKLPNSKPIQVEEERYVEKASRVAQNKKRYSKPIQIIKKVFQKTKIKSKFSM
jgi:hypothetical protein